MRSFIKLASCIFLSTIFISNISIAREGDQISIVGSSTVFPFSTIVAERFAKNTDFRAPVIESTGTGGETILCWHRTRAPRHHKCKPGYKRDRKKRLCIKWNKSYRVYDWI